LGSNPNEIFINAAKKAFGFLINPNNNLIRIENNDVIFLEFSHKSPVLNGWIFTLFGLYDYYLITKDLDALDFFNNSSKTLSKKLEIFDRKYWSNYNMDYSIASPFYHNLHISLLNAMHIITSENQFLETSNRYKVYNSNFFYRTRAFLAKSLQKIFEKSYE
jgi:hypothetical protein